MSAYFKQSLDQDVVMEVDTDDASLAQLLTHLHLDTDSAHTVYEFMQTEQVGFIDAVLHLGLVTQEQVDEARAAARSGRAPQGAAQPD